MFGIAWRHSPRTGWNLLADPVPSEQDARTKINQMTRYDMVGREYRIVRLGDADTWTDPVREQAERLGVADRLDKE